MSKFLVNRNGYEFDDPFFGDFFSSDLRYGLMKTDIRDDGDKYEMSIEVPDVKKEDIKISLEKGNLIVKTSFNNNKEEKENHGRYICKERITGVYSRSYYVGENVRYEDISAKLEDGVLKLDINKRTKQETNEEKYIEIH